ncbi:MAG: hypothetical protein QG675_251 [Patescibacteria group bacterium]|jgi:tRNA G10  N-methylase Trm11|nr:hypothetical protein [Patescibacteria group bacterium]
MICAIIGREKNLAYAELESVVGSFDKINSESVVFEYTKDTSLDIDRFGTVIKLANLHGYVNSFDELYVELAQAILNTARSKDSSNIDFGISLYGKNISYKTYKRLLINTKKTLAKNGVRSRFVESKNSILNSAQIKHNKLISTGIEVVILFSTDKIAIAITHGVQDVDSYSKRDYGRPCRDMKVGMFPPKLAQSMLNISQAQQDSIIYDPFCGSGIVLQESMLHGHQVWGSDISDRMVQCSNSNIKWLQDNYQTADEAKIFMADATKIRDVPDRSYHIVTEGFLGSAQNNIPSPNQIEELRAELSMLYLNFLKNLKTVARTPESIVLTLPCWKQKEGLERLNIVDQIQKLGYTIKQFQSVEFDEVIYKRPNQIVGRQILSIKPKGS